LKDLISLSDLTPPLLGGLLDLADRLKSPAGLEPYRGLLEGRILAMLFAKPSLRTRVSFDVGMRQLGGDALYLSPGEIGLGTRESTADVARVLSRYVDGIMARVFAHADVVDLARHASVPVINGLSDLTHPCQGLADLQTVREAHGRLEGVRLVYLGDGNNVAHSLLYGGALAGMHVAVVHPAGYAPLPEVLATARSIAARTGATVTATSDLAAVDGADVLYTDVWASMGQEAEAESRKVAFRAYQLNEALLARAAPGAIVLHCLPAHRGDEITDEVLDGSASRVFDQAENRLHAQKAVLAWLIGDVPPA
jgi:ornithine carbamoyltransferase